MRRPLFLLAIITILASCTKKEDDHTPPGKAVLVFPAKDALCTTGTNITATESTVTFSWNTTEHTDGYQLIITNLVTKEVITKNTANNQMAVTIPANAPYSWSVNSVSAGVPNGTKSNEWRFYNAGLGITSYAPFPATMVSPTYNQSVTATGGKVTLTWTGSDVDNDINYYTVFCDKNATPLQQVIANTQNTSFNTSVTSGSIYYWYVQTYDKQGNVSKSETFKFTVN
ncbi:hypothetical protein HQ865_01970 [Mucilaginibacter mali]|uniref:Fibronectin type-III domain-containing protein n=1 Tax=Mucilaginibacter mali TaxID=2740462 RepID=A0A7D4QD19_9SPHI|nr:hypothetical protein [Mucilaginibacter mali]QKJ28572.1 hypothetical protein HQ865_01970 [Mucilaginibacter mali]